VPPWSKWYNLPDAQNKYDDTKDNKSKLFEQVTLCALAELVSQRTGAAIHNQQTDEGENNHNGPYHPVPLCAANKVITHVANIGCKK
jgi:hypothetical protein